jgi:carboxypeptidase Taq
MNETYSAYSEYMKKIADLSNLYGLASWDQEVMMPEKGMEFRARQMATIAGIIHEMFVSEKLETFLNQLGETSDLNYTEKANIRETAREYNKKKKLPTELVELESKTVSQAYQAWIQARKENNFKTFLPKLKEVIDIQKKKADLQGYKDHPYDALLDDYEPGLTTARLDEIFKDVKAEIVGLIKKIQSLPQPLETVMEGEFSKEKQLALCRQIVSDLGYSWETGRLDLSEHPFSISFDPYDARITTRVNEHDIQECIWGAIHETGHAFYELGLPAAEYGLPAGSAASLSMHESQSRLWENNVGKSLNFIKAYYPLIKETFPEKYNPISESEFFGGLNIIRPDLIRINSDEVTYHLHILLRFEIEKGLIEGSLLAENLDEIWNGKIKDYLGLDVPSSKMGVLQDIHWSHGSFGYFPTYSLGSFYAAQFYAAAEKQIENLDEKIRRKEFAPLLQWLRTNVHQYGHSYSPEEICEKATDEKLNFKYFSDYIHRKYSVIYDLNS